MMKKRSKAMIGVLASIVVLVSASPAAAQVEVQPTADGLPGAGVLQSVVNWGGQIALIFSLGALLAGGALYGWSYFQGRTQGAHRGQQLAMGGAVGALLTGVAPFVVNALFNAGVAGG